MWVVDMEKKLDAGVESPPATVEDKWRKHCVFRVPPHFKVIHGNVFTPQTVSLGPFHHGRSAALRSMEEHKRRAVRHLLRRAGNGKTARDLAAAVEAVAGELEDMYDDEALGSDWRGGVESRGRFLELMVTDGCFLLEVMARRFDDYAPGDPVFSRHAVAHIAAFVQRDMLMVENQLPLLVLLKIASVVVVPTPNEASINKEVLKFLGVNHAGAAAGRLGLHPLDIYRRSLLGSAPRRRSHVTPLNNDDDELDVPRSAQKLWEAGIRFRRSRTDLLDDVDFDGVGKRWLDMPRVWLDDSTEHKFRNMMAFEALHAGGGTGNDVTAFVLFMKDMVDSVADVARLRAAGVLRHDLAGSDRAVVRLLHGLTKDVAKIGESRLCTVREEVERHCRASWRVFVFESWAKLRNTYFTSLWGTVALTVSVFLLITDVMQTAYAVMSYELTKHRHG